MGKLSRSSVCVAGALLYVLFGSRGRRLMEITADSSAPSQPRNGHACDMGRASDTILQKLGTEPSFLLPRHLQDTLYQKPPVPSQPPENTQLEPIIWHNQSWWWNYHYHLCHHYRAVLPLPGTGPQTDWHDPCPERLVLLGAAFLVCDVNLSAW